MEVSGQLHAPAALGAPIKSLCSSVCTEGKTSTVNSLCEETCSVQFQSKRQCFTTIRNSVSICVGDVDYGYRQCKPLATRSHCRRRSGRADSRLASRRPASRRSSLHCNAYRQACHFSIGLAYTTLPDKPLLFHAANSVAYIRV
jgi:hypothetical protein